MTAPLRATFAVESIDDQLRLALIGHYLYGNARHQLGKRGV